MNEVSMARALGLKPKAVKAERTPGLTVVLAVRHSWGGLPWRFTYNASTISVLEAQCLASQEARRQGLRIHALLEIE